MAEAEQKQDETKQDEVSVEDVRNAVNNAANEADSGKKDDGSNEYTESELEALDLGWYPEGKDKDGNQLTAEEYLVRRPLFQRIHNLNDQINEMKNQIDGLQSHNKISAERARLERENLIKELKEAKEKAYEELDVDEARNIDKKIEELQEDIKPDTTKFTEEDWNKEYTDFQKGNDWYEKDVGLTAAATNVGQVYKENNPNCSPKELFNHVEEKIKEMFPASFEGEKKTTKVGTTQRRGHSTPSKKHSMRDIPEEHQMVARNVIASGVSEEEYLKQYFGE